MTVTVGSSAADLWTLPDESETAVATLAATRAITFMRAQVLWLQRGLASGSDKVAVDIVISAHDRSHERWVRVISHVDTHLGHDAAQHVASVYRYVGRIAGSLENGGFSLLGDDLAARAREVLADNLAEVAEQAVEAVWRIAAEA